MYNKHDLLQDLLINGILLRILYKMNKNLRKQSYLLTMLVFNLIWTCYGYYDVHGYSFFIMLSSIGLNGGCALASVIVMALIGKSKEHSKKYHVLFNAVAIFCLLNAIWWASVAILNPNFNCHEYSPGWGYWSDLVTGGYSLIMLGYFGSEY